MVLLLWGLVVMGRWMGVAISEGDDGSGAVEGRGGGKVIVRELGENEGKRKT